MRTGRRAVASRGWLLAWTAAFVVGMASSQLGLSTSAFTSQLSRAPDTWSAGALQPVTGLTASDGCGGSGTVSAVGATGAGVAGSTVSLAVPAGVQVGDLLLAQLVNDNTSSPPAGFTLLIDTTGGGNIQSRVYTRVATASDVGASHAFTVTGGKATGSMTAVRGSAGTPAAAGVDNGKTTVLTAPSLPGGTSGALLLALFGDKQPDATYSTPTGMTPVIHVGTTGTSQAVFRQTLTASGATGTRTTTASTPAESVSTSVLLSPTASATVELSWTPAPSPIVDGHEVLRDGVLVATLGPGAGSWTDPAPTSSSHTYDVVATAGSWRSPAATSTATLACLPTTALDAPPPLVAGTVALTATASDDTGVASVQFQRSPAGAGTWTTVCTDATAPYTCSWSTTASADGQYDLRTVATDTGGASGTSAVVQTTVDNTGPTVVMTDPGSPVAAPTTLTATVSDAGSGVAGVTYQYAPAGTTTWTTACTATAAPWSCSWDSSALVTGSYDLRAVATDAAGNSTASATLAGRQAGSAPPSVFAGIGPAAGRTSSGSLTAQYPAGTEQGDLVLLVQANAANQAITSPAGWSLVADQAGSSPQQFRVTVWAREAGPETSVTTNVNTSSAGTTFWVVRYDRPAGSAPLAAAHTALRQGSATGGSTLTPAPDVTTTDAARVVQLAVVRAPNPLSLATPQGFALRASAAGTGTAAPTLGVADTTTATAQTVASPTWSQSGTAAQWAWVGGAYR